MTQKEWIKLTNGKIDSLLRNDSPLVRLLGEKNIPYKIKYWLKRLVLTFQTHAGAKAYFETKNEILGELFDKYSMEDEVSKKKVVPPANIQAYNDEFSSRMKDIFNEEVEFTGLHKIIVNMDEISQDLLDTNDMIIMDEIMKFIGKDIDEEHWSEVSKDNVISIDDKRKEKE